MIVAFRQYYLLLRAAAPLAMGVPAVSPDRILKRARPSLIALSSPGTAFRQSAYGDVRGFHRRIYRCRRVFSAISQRLSPTEHPWLPGTG